MEQLLLKKNLQKYFQCNTMQNNTSFFVFKCFSSNKSNWSINTITILRQNAVLPMGLQKKTECGIIS